MPPISVLVKPASSSCNMRCRYCFYHDASSQRSVKNYGYMEADTYLQLAKRIFECASGQVTIAFQGGEPLLAGLRRFQKYVEITRECNHARVPVYFSVQTNGSLIDEAWCDFFRANRFLVGISLDGTRELHDLFRKTGEIGSYADTMKKIELLKKYEIDFSVLTVVTKQIASHAQKIYKQYTLHKFPYVQFIPCLDPLDEAHREYSLTPAAYGKFLTQLYHLWNCDAGASTRMGIRLFENVASICAGKAPEMCAMQGHCSLQNVVEADGSVYPCDFYCLDEWYLGNIFSCGLKALFESPNAQKFMLSSFEKSRDCADCAYAEFCRGGCRRERRNGKNYFCQSYQMLFDAALQNKRA